MGLLKTIAVMSYMSLADYSLITRIRAFFIMHWNQQYFFVSVDVEYITSSQGSIDAKVLMQCNDFLKIYFILFKC